MKELRSRRVRAAWADIGLLFLALVAFSAAAGNLQTGPNEYGVVVEGLPALMYFLFILAYYFVLELASGQTLGKRWLGIAVGSAAGGPATPRQVAVRTLLRIVDWLPFLYLVGYIAIRATGDRGLRLGDLAAKTTVGTTETVTRSQRLTLRASLGLLAAAGVLLLAATLATGGGDSASEPDELSETQQLLADAAFRTANLGGPRSGTAVVMVPSEANPAVIRGSGDPESGVGVSTLTIGTRSVEIRFIRETSWVRGVPDGGHAEWLQADTSALAAAGQIDPSLRQPEVFLLLGAENVESRPDGPGNLDSWQFTIDRERAIEAAPAEDRTRVSRAISGPPEGSFTGDVTVDATGLVRSFTARAESPAENGQPAELAEIQLTFRALAQPPKVERPAPDDVRPADPAEVQAFVERWLDL